MAGPESFHCGARAQIASGCSKNMRVTEELENSQIVRVSQERPHHIMATLDILSHLSLSHRPCLKMEIITNSAPPSPNTQGLQPLARAPKSSWATQPALDKSRASGRGRGQREKRPDAERWLHVSSSSLLAPALAT